jgi:hypothetical protein
MPAPSGGWWGVSDGTGCRQFRRSVTAPDDSSGIQNAAISDGTGCRHSSH